jgi:hypothetical protein
MFRCRASAGPRNKAYLDGMSLTWSYGNAADERFSSVQNMAEREGFGHSAIAITAMPA